MTPEPPDPQHPDGRGTRPDGADPRAPRILVSVGDLEDPADWDVIVVENDAIDDDTARKIASQRTGHQISLPSLDESDVMRALETDRDAEDVEGLSADAFGPPEGAAEPRRARGARVMPEDDGFAGLPEPDPEPEPPTADHEDEVEATDADAADEPDDAEPAEAPAPWSPADLTPMEPVTARRPTEAHLDAELGDEPASPDEPADTDEAPAALADVDWGSAPSADAGADPDAIADEPADEVVAGEVAADAEPQPFVGHEGTDLIDDPHDDFYDIGDDTIAVADDLVADATDTDGVDTDPEAEAEAAEDEDHEPELSPIDEDRDLLDDPDDAFFALGAHAATALAAAKLRAGIPAVPGATPAPVGPDLWGTPSAVDAPAVDEPAGDADEVAAVADLDAEVPFEDEIEFDSSFPLSPADVLVAGDAEPVQLDSLDYASVFGPVQGTLTAPDLPPPAPRRRPRPVYYSGDDTGAIDADDEYDDDLDDPWPVTPARRGRGRRRELVVLGLAAAAIAAIGLGSQVFGGDRPEVTAGPDSTTTTQGSRVTAIAPTSSTLFLPTTTPSDSPLLGTGGADGGTDATTATTRRPRTTTTTTKKPGSTTTSSTPPATTTTAPPATTTTTAPPATTTTLDAGTTGGATDG
jgi:hypothetical protein